MFCTVCEREYLLLKYFSLIHRLGKHFYYQKTTDYRLPNTNINKEKGPGSKKSFSSVYSQFFFNPVRHFKSKKYNYPKISFFVLKRCAFEPGSQSSKRENNRSSQFNLYMSNVG